METINGYTVIADRDDEPGKTRIILGVRAVMTAVRVGGFEYVVARCALRSETPTFWHQGNYTMDLDDAVQTFRDR